MFDPLWDWLADNRWMIKVISHVIALAIMFAVGLAIFGGLTLFGVIDLEDVQAASPAATDNACVEIGNVRGVYIAHCVDPDTGRELYANSIGFIEVVE